MAKYDGSMIEILNWGKYNPRFDSKRPSWFRLEVGFCSGQDYFDLPPVQKWGWVMLMSSACQKNGSPFRLRYEWLRMFTDLSAKEIDELVEYFVQKGALRVTRASLAPEENESGRNLPTTDGRTDEQSHASVFDFEKIYERYPNKKGRTKGEKAFKGQIKTPEDYDALARAVDRYAAECRKDGTDKKFIKHFSTFMNCWRDYAEAPSQPALDIAPRDNSHAEEFRRKREEMRLAAKESA